MGSTMVDADCMLYTLVVAYSVVFHDHSQVIARENVHINKQGSGSGLKVQPSTHRHTAHYGQT